MAKGRPQMEAGKRTRKIDVRFTEEEYQIIINLESALGIGKTELLRRRTLNDGVATVVNARELIKTLDAIFAEMGRVGNNLNQLAKHANTLKLQGMVSPMVAELFNNYFQEYLQVQRQLEITLRKVIRLIGKS